MRDSYTQELANEIQTAIFQETGCYPHVIINLLHRKKFDANRDLGDAADGNSTVEAAWYAYHEFIDTAKYHIAEKYNRGMFFDLHGHGHTIQRIELGYTLTKSELQMSDNDLNTASLINESSIRLLVSDNIQNLTHADLIRGNQSFGTMLDHQGFPAVPSTADPFPQNADPYFTGGYNTRRYGSENADTLDAIQIECNQHIRFDATIRQEFADSIALSMLRYIDFHYSDDFSENYCNLISSIHHSHDAIDISIYPNPVCQQLTIENYKLRNGRIEIFNALGQAMFNIKLENGANQFSVDFLENGFYFIKVYERSSLVFQQKLFKACD